MQSWHARRISSLHLLQRIHDMTNRKATPSLLYSAASSIGWVRTLSSFIDEGMAALCVRQWQRAPVVVAQPAMVASPRRRIR